jgi:hypothetical protein
VYVSTYSLPAFSTSLRAPSSNAGLHIAFENRSGLPARSCASLLRLVIIDINFTEASNLMQVCFYSLNQPAKPTQHGRLSKLCAVSARLHVLQFCWISFAFFVADVRKKIFTQWHPVISAITIKCEPAACFKPSKLSSAFRAGRINQINWRIFDRHLHAGQLHQIMHVNNYLHVNSWNHLKLFCFIHPEDIRLQTSAVTSISNSIHLQLTTSAALHSMYIN